MNVASITTDLLRDFSAKRTENGVTGPTVNRNLAMLRRMFKLAERESKVSSIPYFPMQQESEPEFEKLRIEMPRNLRPNLLLRDGVPHGCYGKDHIWPWMNPCQAGSVLAARYPQEPQAANCPPPLE